jgi:hypothetical protein
MGKSTRNFVHDTVTNNKTKHIQGHRNLRKNIQIFEM